MDRNRADIDAELAAAGGEDGERLRSAAVDALRALDVTAPDTLRRAVEREVEAATAPRAARRPLRPREALVQARRRPGRIALVLEGLRLRASRRPGTLTVGSLAMLAIVVSLVLAGGNPPSVQDAARAALRPATAPAPATRPGGEVLAADVDGIVYPTWHRVGWRVVGERTDKLDGHEVRTVLYADGGGRRVGYAIAAGDALPVEGGRIVERRGAQLRLLTVDGATVVTWRRDGHTCILASRHVAPARLLQLASYAT